MLPPNSLLIDRNKKMLEVTVVSELLSVGEVRGEMDNITNIDPLNTDLPPRSQSRANFSSELPFHQLNLVWFTKEDFYL